MSDEYETTESTPSIFWPLLLLVLGILMWVGFEDYALNSQRSMLKQNLTEAGPIYTAAMNWKGKYNSIMQDLAETGKKDPYAAQIFRMAIPPSVQAGLVNVQQPQGTNSTANPAAPTSSAPASGATNTPPK